MGLIFDKRGSYDRKHVPRAHQPALEFRRLGVLREAGSPPPVTGSLVRGRVWVALPRTSLHSARYLPSRACSLLAAYRAARLPGPGGAVVPSRNVTRAVFRSPPCRSPTSRLQSPWRAILDRLHVSSFVAPQTKALKCPLRFATGTSNVSFQGNLACCLLGYADGGINLRAGGSRPANGIVGQAAADSTCAEMRSRALTARHLYLSAVGFYLYSKRFPRHLPNLT